MPICKFCGVPFVWARLDDRFIPLIPTGEDEGLVKALIDSDGVYRADHKEICTNPFRKGDTVTVIRAKTPQQGD